MYYYKKMPIFDRYTGKKLAPSWSKAGKIDDFTGDKIPDDPYVEAGYSVGINYESGSEPLWYEDKEHQEFGYERYAKFVSQPYHFLAEEYGMHDNSIHLIKEWLRDIGKKGSVFFGCVTLEQAYKAARLRTMRKLINNKTFKVEELMSGEEEEE